MGSLLLQIFSPKKRNICTVFYNFLCGIHQKRDSLVFYSCGKYRNSLMFSVLEPAPLSVWNLHHFPSGICIPFPSGTYLHPFPLESGSLLFGICIPIPMESTSFHSGICISFHPEPASLPSRICFPPLWNLHRFSSGTCIPCRWTLEPGPLEPASLSVWNPLPFPSGICIPYLSRALALCAAPVPRVRVAVHFLRRFSSRPDNTATKKKKLFSLSHWLKNRASSNPKIASFIWFFVRGFCSCRVGRCKSFWVDLRPFVSLARAACKVTKIRSYNNNLQDLQLLVSTVLIAEQ